MSTETTVSMEWYLNNVTASVDADMECVTCHQRISIYGDNAGTCVPCRDNGMDHYPICTEDDWNSLIDRKWEECGGSSDDDYGFAGGINRPICIVYCNGTFVQGNGNHRVAYSIMTNQKTIKAVFSLDFKKDWMMSPQTGY